MREPWIGLVELITPPSEFGDTRCFTHVLVWAETPAGFASTISQFLEQEGMSILKIEWSHPVAQYNEVPVELEEFIEWAREHPDDWCTSDRHYYPSKPA